MPLYDLYCDDCKHEEEKSLKLDQETPKCPKCGQQMKKAISCTSFVLKGGGWASDGYSKNKGKVQ